MIIVSAFTDVILSITLFYEEQESNQPIKIKENLIDFRLLVIGLLFLGPLTTGLAYVNFIIYFKFYSTIKLEDLVLNFSADYGEPLLVAQTIGFYSIVVMQCFGNIYSIRNRHLLMIESVLADKTHQNWYLIFSSLFVYAFATTIVSFSIPNITVPIPPIFYAITFVFAILVLFINEIRKLCIYRYDSLQNYLSW